MLAAMAVAALCLALVGVLVELAAYRPIYPAGRLPAVVSALGASIIIQNLIMIVWGPRYQAYPASAIPNLRLEVGAFGFTALQLVILGISFALRPRCIS
jgi:branched-chain amino acid transport system permease protein